MYSPVLISYTYTLKKRKPYTYKNNNSKLETYYILTPIIYILINIKKP